MPFKFEKLEVYQLSLAYIDLAYEIAGKLPANEEYNLKSQLKRAATSIALNIAEGSSGQTDVEQTRFIGYAIRSLLETVACQQIIQRRNFIADTSILKKFFKQSEILAAKLYAFRKAIDPEQRWVRENESEYVTENK
jgi:four helix bundle protein